MNSNLSTSKLASLAAWAMANALAACAYLSLASQVWERERAASQMGELDPGAMFHRLSFETPLLIGALIVNFGLVIFFRRASDAHLARNATIQFRVMAGLWILVLLADRLLS